MLTFWKTIKMIIILLLMILANIYVSRAQVLMQ